MGLCLEKQFDGANKFVFMPPIPAKCRAINKPGNPRAEGRKGEIAEREREKRREVEREREVARLAEWQPQCNLANNFG